MTKSNIDRRVLNAIERELLRELHIEKDTLLDTIENAVNVASFHAQKYKVREEYENLLKLKRAYNILRTFLHVTNR